MPSDLAGSLHYGCMPVSSYRRIGREVGETSSTVFLALRQKIRVKSESLQSTAECGGAVADQDQVDEPVKNFMRTRRAEHFFLATGMVLLAVWAGAWIQRTVSCPVAVRRFEAEQARSSEGTPVMMNRPASGSSVDFTLWSEKRVDAYKQSLVDKPDRPLALLRIPKIHLKAPVYNDTDDLTLNRGVGRILGTAEIGSGGNVGIAGHRDGFFRGLKDIAPGDEIELVRIDQSDSYVVENTHIVNPEDVSVLEPTRVSSLTLVTCFPFYYIGSAPQRFIVRASVAGSGKSRPKLAQSNASIVQIN